MACLHCPAALHPATYLSSLEVMALELFLSAKCCDRASKRGFFCGGAGARPLGDLSPLSIRERVARLQMTSSDT